MPSDREWTAQETLKLGTRADNVGININSLTPINLNDLEALIVEAEKKAKDAKRDS